MLYILISQASYLNTISILLHVVCVLPLLEEQPRVRQFRRVSVSKTHNLNRKKSQNELCVFHEYKEWCGCKLNSVLQFAKSYIVMLEVLHYDAKTCFAI